uniref:hypothetical protein n=1 Tax=uncultured Deinococcus sp. TaxID=158789 RepID=UPI00374964C5
IPQTVYDAFDRFSRNANKTDGGTHPFDQNRFYSAVEEAFNNNTNMDFPEFDSMLKKQGWINEQTRKRLFDDFEAAYSMAKHLRNGTVY